MQQVKSYWLTSEYSPVFPTILDISTTSALFIDHYIPILQPMFRRIWDHTNTHVNINLATDTACVTIMSSHFWADRG